MLAILYRALEGPKDFRDWRSLYTSKVFNQKILTRYFNQYRNRFELFSDIHPFFQLAGLETKEPISVNRLATECASGHNATLFDHSNDQEEVKRLMLTPISDDITPREPYNGYLIFQGGIPEVEEFIKQNYL